MPTIRSISYSEINYDELSSLCHSSSEPVCITKNGMPDLMILSVEAYEQLMGCFELYGLIQDGQKDIEKGNTRSVSEALEDIRKCHSQNVILRSY